MDLISIRACGNMIANYANDLTYFENSKRWSQNDLDDDRFKVILYKFIAEYKVVRNVPKEKKDQFFTVLMDYYRGLIEPKIAAVGNLVELFIKQTVTTDNLVSLCSKLMYLYRPAIYFPYDSLARKTIHNHGLGAHNTYQGFFNAVNILSQRNAFLVRINEIDHFANNLLNIIEAPFIERGYFTPNEISTIRKNRIIDKLLVSFGNNNIL